MTSPGCRTLAGYNATFGKLFNKCNAKDQVFAAHAYAQGIHPKYLRYIPDRTRINLDNLAEAKAAVTLAVATYEQLELSYANFSGQKGRGEGSTDNNRSLGNNQQSYRRTVE